MNFDEVEIIDGVKKIDEYIEELIRRKNQEDAFYILDVGDVINKYKTWRMKFPTVEPYFTMKCNPNPTVVKTLSALNANFNCVSKQELEQVLSNGVSGDRIIFSNAVKPHSHIKFAKKVGVNVLTVDNEFELYKIKSIFPEAKIIICFRCDSSVAVAKLGSKFGCDLASEAPKIIRKAKDLGLKIHGFSFHVGSQCRDVTAHSRGIKIALDLIAYAKSLGFENVNLIDIGGGFPGEKDHPIDDFANAINKVIVDIDPSIKIISEPGRYYTGSAFTLVSLVYGKRTIDEENGYRKMYYINDGTYGSFLEAMLTIMTRVPRPLHKPVHDKTYSSTFWGPTCDSYDCVIRNCDFPELNVGDWLVWPDMGAYTVSLAKNFNGMLPPAVFPFIRRKDWNFFLKLVVSEKIEPRNGIKKN